MFQTAAVVASPTYGYGINVRGRQLEPSLRTRWPGGWPFSYLWVCEVPATSSQYQDLTTLFTESVN